MKTTTELIELIRIDFDTMENSNPTREECIFVFTASNEKTAHGVCDEYIRTVPVTLYLGWDSEVYPKFKIKRRTITSID